MSRTLALASLALVASVAGTSPALAGDNPLRGLESVNVPVVIRSDYAVDLSAPDGSLGPREAARLDGWFRGLDLGYGDTVYVDGYADAAREDVARIAGNYGMLVSLGAPLTAGQVGPGSVRVVVSRTRAEVPTCPNWTVKSAPTTNNIMMSNFGCALNANLAAMVANPEDLVHGREGSGVVDSRVALKALEYYRTSPPTGQNGLKDIRTSKKGN